MSKSTESDETTVWVSTDNHASIYHTDKHCSAFKTIDNVAPKKVNQIPTYKECKICKNQALDRQKMDEQICNGCGETYRCLADHLRACSAPSPFECQECDREPVGVIKTDESSHYLCRYHYRKGMEKYSETMTEHRLLPE